MSSQVCNQSEHFFSSTLVALSWQPLKLATTEASSELEPDMGGPNRGAVILPSGNSFYFSTWKIKSNQDRGRALELQSHR